MNARALVFAFLAAVAVGAGLYALLRSDPTGDEPEPAAPAATAPPEKPTVRPMLTGTIVLRVKASDGKPLPPGAVGGYRSGRDPRLRPLSAEGIVRFADVPLVEPGPTPLEAVAQAPGYFPASKEVFVSRDVPNETVLTLTPIP